MTMLGLNSDYFESDKQIREIQGFSEGVNNGYLFGPAFKLIWEVIRISARTGKEFHIMLGTHLKKDP